MRTRTRAAAGLILFLLCLASPAWAAVYYVSVADGLDTNTGLSSTAGAPGGPLQTVAKVNTGLFPLASGSVSLANTKISSVDGTAFLDLGATVNVAQYVGRKITVTMHSDAAKSIVGYILAAGTAETYGSELHTTAGATSDPNGNEADTTDGWANAGYETFESSGADKSVGSYSLHLVRTAGTDEASAKATATTNWLLRKMFAIKAIAAGSARVNHQYGGGTQGAVIVSAPIPNAWTSYTAYATVVTGGAYCGIDVISPTNNSELYIDNLSVRKTLTPSATGVLIVSAAGGAIRNFTSITAGFSYADATGYDYVIENVLGAGDTISFKRGETWREQLTVPVSGSAGSPITFGAYGTGAAPILDGADLLASWTSEPVNIAGEDFTDGAGNTPVSWWMFEDAGTPSLDGSATGNTMGWEGTATRSATRIQGSYSVSLPTTADDLWRNYTNLAATTPFKAATTSFTVGGWVYLVASGTTSRPFFSLTDYSAKGVDIRKNGADGKIRGIVYSSGGTATVPADAAYTTGWYHIVVRWNGDNVAGAGAEDEISLWVNGVKQSTTVIRTSVALVTASGMKFIGAADAATLFDEWFLCAVPLLDTEIQSIYTYGLAGERNNVAFTTYYATAAVEPKFVLADSTVLTSVATKALLTPGTFWWDAANTRVYVRLAGDADPAGSVVNAPQRDRGVSASGKSYLTIRDLELLHFNEHAISLSTSTSIIVDTVTISYAYNHGVYAPAGAATVRNSTISYVYRGIEYKGGGNAISSNTLHHIPFQSSMPDTYPFPVLASGADDASAVSNNVIHDNGAFGTIDSIHGIYVDGGQTNQLIYGNTVYNIPRGHGIKFIGASGSIYRNLVHDCYYGGIAVNSNGAVNVTVSIYSNILYGNHFGFVEYGKGAGEINVSLYNNTLYLNNSITRDASPNEINLDDDVTSLVIKNNIVYATANRFAYSMPTQSGAVINHNALYQASGNLIYYNASARTWATWQGYGFDTAGLNADPLLVSPSTGDFHLQAGSPAINAGVDVGLTSDYAGATVPQGSAPDIGAYERLAPVAGFSGAPLSGRVPLAVAFTDATANTPTSWAWTFGDGTTSTAENPSHTYTTPGAYTVSLTATSTVGPSTQTRTTYVEVATRIMGGGLFHAPLGPPIGALTAEPLRPRSEP